MSRQHVSHREIQRFAQENVNLPKDLAEKYRGQVHRLREQLENYISENPDFTLRKMQLSGSLAKGTALRSINDIDVACYISGVNEPSDVMELLKYIKERLREAFPNFRRDQVKAKTYSVTVSFRGTGLDVDVVPILYDGNPDGDGYLFSQDGRFLLKTNIDQHLEFARKRKKAQPRDFAQVVRLIKFWVKNLKQENPDFRFKSFMVEMILSLLCDQGHDFRDYPEALQNFFTYIAKSNLREKIVFADYYPPSNVGDFGRPVQIVDPVNEKNNVAQHYTESQANAIVEAALDAGDAIDAALAAPTKGETIHHWCRVFGSDFNILGKSI